MIIHNTTSPSQQIYLNSNNPTSLLNDSFKSHILFELADAIRIPNNVDCYMKVNSFKYINTFYIVNENNNVFYYSLSPALETILTLTIPVGNYNITSLIEYLNSNTELVFTYLSSNFKVNITHPTKTFKLYSGQNTCLKLLGFIATNESNNVTSPYVINLSGVQVLYICSNFSVIFNSCKSNSINNILCDINNDVMSGISKSYYNSSNSLFKVADSIITSIEISIFDENKNYVNFNNTDWFLSLSLQFSYKNEYKPPIYLNVDNQEIPGILDEAENNNLAVV